jgi:hypothetical protein
LILSALGVLGLQACLPNSWFDFFNDLNQLYFGIFLISRKVAKRTESSCVLPFSFGGITVIVLVLEVLRRV